VVVVGPEKPKPGMAGITRWKRSRSSGIRSRNSAVEPGQPWVRISGRASGSVERICRKCTFCPSIWVTKPSNASSRAGQSNSIQR
jgi:hypothetical protein